MIIASGRVQTVNRNQQPPTHYLFTQTCIPRTDQVLDNNVKQISIMGGKNNFTLFSRGSLKRYPQSVPRENGTGEA